MAFDYERDESYSLQPLVIERIGINFMGIDAKDRLFLGVQFPTTLEGEIEHLVTLDSEGNPTPFSQNVLAAVDEIGFSVPRFFDLGSEGWLLSLLSLSEPRGTRRWLRLDKEGNLSDTLVSALDLENTNIWDIFPSKIGGYIMDGGVSAFNILRLNADGSINPEFIDPKPNENVEIIAEALDGTLYVKYFSEVIHSLDTSGAITQTFDSVNADQVDAIVPLPNGQVLFAGPWIFSQLGVNYSVAVFDENNEFVKGITLSEEEPTFAGVIVETDQQLIFTSKPEIEKTNIVFLDLSTLEHTEISLPDDWEFHANSSNAVSQGQLYIQGEFDSHHLAKISLESPHNLESFLEFRRPGSIWGLASGPLGNFYITGDTERMLYNNQVFENITLLHQDGSPNRDFILGPEIFIPTFTKALQPDRQGGVMIIEGRLASSLRWIEDNGSASRYTPNLPPHFHIFELEDGRFLVSQSPIIPLPDNQDTHLKVQDREGNILKQIDGVHVEDYIDQFKELGSGYIAALSSEPELGKLNILHLDANLDPIQIFDTTAYEEDISIPELKYQAQLIGNSGMVGLLVSEDHRLLKKMIVYNISGERLLNLDLGSLAVDFIPTLHMLSNGAIVFNHEGFLKGFDASGELFNVRDINGEAIPRIMAIDALDRLYYLNEETASLERFVAIGLSETLDLEDTIVSLETGDAFEVSLPLETISGARYQWLKNGQPIPDQKSPRLNLPPVRSILSGEYSLEISNHDQNVSVASFQLQVAPMKSWLSNLSLRGFTGPGEQTLIAGYVIDGSGDQMGSLTRSIGPGLLEQDVNNPLLQTSLRAFEGSQSIAFLEADHSNPDAIAATNRLGAFQLDESSLDTALYLTQEAGVYGAHSATDPQNPGISLIELYLDYVSDNLVPSLKYRNLSGRGYVSQDEGALIGGFVIDGNGPKTVLIRGVGPGLAEQNVTDFLSDPIISLYQNGQLIAQNDNWSDAEIESEANRIGAFALTQNSQDAGLIVTLEPGIYGAIMTSSNPDKQGIGLLEIYDLDD